ncbi:MULTISPECIES: hypothetical protein [Bradyrhizobium]|jgi:hypothetical protein|uniref:hypothetical protein n=1 Tax=Bradyrhizobium TaxID=374 RepID=UPI0012FE38DF|nr:MULTISPECIES: hypothetical protein [Bradyrhizobium]MDI2110448.1 hypothetical protein [Bradyrhizobium sp. Mp64]WLB04502.1 hypothetical protein QNJ80_21920 [Bradyrhizobium elkanii]
MNDSYFKKLSTAAAVVDAIGGTFKAAEIAECKPPAISNAIARGRLPSPTFLVFDAELTKRGFKAPPELWGIRSPRRRRR